LRKKVRMCIACGKVLPAGRSYLRCDRCGAPVCNLECLAKHVETHYVIICV